MKEAPHSWFEPVDSKFGPWQTLDSESANPDFGSFDRLWSTFMTARVTIASVLVVLQAFIHALGSISNSWSIALCIAYLGATLAVRVWARPKPPGSTFDAQWLSTIGVDVMVFSALNFLQSSGINYTPLFALPVLLASILGPILLALGTAASVTLLLLADAWWFSSQFNGEYASRLLQSGLSGSGFFAVALLANQLALRLVREEQRSKSSRAVARMQTQVNELVVETLVDGVLVIDAHGVVRSANPASARLLAMGDATHTAPFVLATQATWQPLIDMMQTTFALRTPQEADVSLDYLGRTARRLRVRTRLAASHDNTNGSLCVMFLQDLREMEARVRTEKLAAMGRMSAAVAHEIRNPLAAISQANALLEEDLQDPAQRRLTAMVSQNAQRLAKIVDEILNISCAQVLTSEQHGNALMLDDTVARITSDWIRQTASADLVQMTTQASQEAVSFDPEHLRRVMINLLDNALRYASHTPAAIKVSTKPSCAHSQAKLCVWSDGQPLEKTVQIHLFEPFFSSESRSSGLGLYISRELCERYGSQIGYQRAVRHGVEGNEFFVLFKSVEQVTRPEPACPPSTKPLPPDILSA